MKETILLFHPVNQAQLLKIQKALMPMKIRLRHIKPADYNQPLGYLAGLKSIQPAISKEPVDGLSDTMIVFANFTNTRLDQALSALRASGAGPLPYKAILTPTNQYWNAIQCFEEIRREHEAMHGEKKA